MGGKNDMKDTQNKELALSEQQIALAKGEQNKSNQLFGLTYPGMKTAEDYYTKLSSGDPDVIARSIAPAAEQIEGASAAAKDRIMSEMPRGGEQRLAMEGADITAASQVGHLATQSYTSAFPALAALAGQGIGLSVNEMSNAIAGLSGAGQTLGNVGQQQAAGKAATMGFLGSLAGAGGQIGAAALTGGGSAAAGVCWIAEVLYGRNDARTHLVRYWLNKVYARKVVGAMALELYRRFGIRVSETIEKYPVLQSPFRILFDAAVRRAKREVSAMSTEPYRFFIDGNRVTMFALSEVA